MTVRVITACMLLAGCHELFSLESVESLTDARPLTGCPSDYTFQLAADPTSYYRPSTSPISWSTASQVCASSADSNTHLVVIDSEAERQQLTAMFTDRPLWIGLTDLGSEGAFHWVTAEGAPVPADGVPPWDVGQPAAEFQAADCVYIGGDGYNDINCTNFEAQFVCECDEFADEPARHPLP